MGKKVDTYIAEYSIEVAHNRGTTFASKDLYIEDFKESSKYQNFVLEMNTQRQLHDVEFRVHYAGSPATVNIERVTLTPA